jgi:MFS family permease
VKIVQQAVQGIRDFLKKQTHNYRMLLIRTSGANFLTSLTNSYTSIYTTGLGADPVTLGALSSVSSAINMLISMPAGWISDRYDLKKVMGIGMAFQVLMIALYAFAQDWKWILVAMMVNPFTMALLFRSQNLIFMRSLRHEDRAKGLSLRMAIASTLGLVAPIPAAMLVDYFGGLTIQGIRPLFYIRFIGMIFVYGYVYMKLEPVPPMPRPPGEKSSFVQDFRDVFKEGKGLKAWLVVSGLGSLIMGMMMSFIYLYAVEIKGAGAWHLGLMTTVETLSFIVFSMPMSRLADTKGRKLAFVLTRPGRLLWMLLLVFAPSPSWLILAWFFRGMSMAGSSYQTWMLELVPTEKRGRWMGITNTVNSLIRIPAPIIGGIIYQSINPGLIFLIPFLLELVVRLPILYFKVPETLRKTSETLTD